MRATTRRVRPIAPDKAGEGWARIERRLVLGPNECWLWTGAKLPTGYGTINVRRSKLLVHRVAFAHFRGDTPMALDHLCRNPACCNPFHLDPVTHRENVARGIGKASWAMRDGTCKAGHPYTDGSYYVRLSPAGNHTPMRQCKTCAAAHVQRFYDSIRSHRAN